MFCAFISILKSDASAGCVYCVDQCVFAVQMNMFPASV